MPRLITWFGCGLNVTHTRLPLGLRAAWTLVSFWLHNYVKDLCFNFDSKPTFLTFRDFHAIDKICHLEFPNKTKFLSTAAKISLKLFQWKRQIWHPKGAAKIYHRQVSERTSSRRAYQVTSFRHKPKGTLDTKDFFHFFVFSFPTSLFANNEK